MALDTDPMRYARLSLPQLIQALLTQAVRTYRERRGLLRAVALLARSRPHEVAKSALRERDEQYRAAGIETLMLHFHPMLTGLRTFIDRIMPKLSRRATPDRIAS